jgi:AraC-like DNA-binding protein
MFLIEDVMGRSFPKEGTHMPFRPNPTKKPFMPPAQVSSPPRADLAPQQQREAAELVRPAGYTGQTGLGDKGQSLAQQREKSSSPIKRLFGLLFGMCRSHYVVETRLHEKRKARKKLQKDMNEVKKALYPNKTPSPLGSEERESNPPTPFEQRYTNYENFDPSHPFTPYASTSLMGFDSQLGGDFGQQGPTFDAPPPPPPPEQPRPSMIDEFAASIFGDTNPGSHRVAPHDYAPSDDQ